MTDDLDARADAFVLGLLDERTAAELETALADDRVWSAAVARARDRLLPLDMSAADLPGAAGLWPAIAPLLAAPSEPAAAAAAHAAPHGAAPDAPSTPPAPANLAQAPRRLIPLGLVAAAGLLAGAVLGGQWFTPEPLVVAVLMDDAGRATAVVEDFGGANARIRFVAQVEVPGDRQMQVWTLPSAERGPVSLGLLAGARAGELDPPSLPVPADGQLYEITLEPQGGSPTGRPTGRILAKGLAAAQTDL